MPYATSVSDKFLAAPPLWTGNIGSGGVPDSSVQTIPLQSAAGLEDQEVYVATIDRVDANATKTPSKREVVIGKLNGSNLTLCLRGAEGAAQSHASGAVIEILFTAKQWSRLIEGILVGHNQDGTHKAFQISEQNKIILTEQEAAPATPDSGEGAIYEKTDGKLYFKNDAGTERDLTAAGIWQDMPATVTRVSDTQFTMPDTGNAGALDLIFKKGTIIKWLEGSTFQTAIVVSSSYATNVVTVNIVGDSFGADFASLKYCLVKANVETFISPGTLPSAAATDISKTFIAKEDIYIISAKPYVKVAGATNATTFDINDDGTTKFTTKLSIASGGVSGSDQVADNPSTPVAEGSLITVDMDSVSTTAPQEAYIDLFYYPVSLRYRS